MRKQRQLPTQKQLQLPTHKTCIQALTVLLDRRTTKGTNNSPRRWSRGI
jgi:hypothetical protein